jgi:hypothetical protein
MYWTNSNPTYYAVPRMTTTRHASQHQAVHAPRDTALTNSKPARPCQPLDCMRMNVPLEVILQLFVHAMGRGEPRAPQHAGGIVCGELMASGWYSTVQYAHTQNVET